MRTLTIAAAIGALAVAALAAPARADSFTFERIRPGSHSSSSIDLSAQFLLDVTAGTGANSGKVIFSLSNLNITGANDAVIRTVYWGHDEDETAPVAAPVTFGSHTGTVSFSNGSSPGDPPGSSDNQAVTGFDWMTEASADADTPKPNVNAINLGETGVFLLALNGSNTFDDVIDAINDGFFTMAFHVQSIDDTGGRPDSDTYVIDNMVPVPEPGSLALMCLGLAGVGILRRRRKRLATA